MAGTPPPSTGGPPGDPHGTRLPRSIFVPQVDPRKDAREAVDSILSDGFMAFLSILLLPIILLPLFVSLSPAVQTLLDFGDATIILFFVVEYASKLSLAPDRRAFVRSPWHLLDLAVIVLSFVTYLPILGLSGRGSAVLLARLLRIPRVFAVAGRAAAARPAAPEAETKEVHPDLPTSIFQVDPGRPTTPRTLSWEELTAHLATETPEWIHLSNVSEESALRLGGLLGLPDQHLRWKQVNDLHPHVGQLRSTILLFVQSGEIRYPAHSRDYFRISRRGAVIILRGAKVISAAPPRSDPFERVMSAPRADDHEFAVSVLVQLLDSLLRDYRSLFTEIELEVTGIGAAPRTRLPKDFLTRAYQVNKSTLRLASNLVHFRDVLGRLAAGRVPVEGANQQARETFEALVEEANYLNEIAKDATENLNNVTDVYINQSSFETNRVLKILAVITALAIIPATIGGLLGIDGPYVFVLWQVILIASVGMLFAGYCFVKLGWLST